MFFLMTAAASSALWAADMEKVRREQEAQAGDVPQFLTMERERRRHYLNHRRPFRRPWPLQALGKVAVEEAELLPRVHHSDSVKSFDHLVDHMIT
jgi:hypothetical protein